MSDAATPRLSDLTMDLAASEEAYSQGGDTAALDAEVVTDPEALARFPDGELTEIDIDSVVMPAGLDGLRDQRCAINVIEPKRRCNRAAPHGSKSGSETGKISDEPHRSIATALSSWQAQAQRSRRTCGVRANCD